MNKNTIQNISIILFNLLFITIHLGGKSGLFIGNLSFFFITVFINYIKNINSINILHKIKNIKSILFFSIIILYTTSFLTLNSEFDQEYCKKYIQFYRNISIIFIFICYFFWIKIDLFKTKTILFICIGTLITIIKRFIQINSFDIKQLFVISHHAPLSLFLVISILLSYFYIKENLKKDKYILLYFFFIILFFFISINNQVGRIGLITSIFMLLIILFDIIKKRKKMYIVSYFIFLIMLIYYIFNNPITNRISNTNIKDPRIVMWKASIDVIKENLSFFGNGLCYSKTLIHEKLMSYNYLELEDYPETGHFHFHNTYIDSIITNGIFGFILTVIIMFFPLLYFIKRKNFIFALFSFILIIQSMTEPILSVDLFIMIHAFFITLMFLHEKKNIS